MLDMPPVDSVIVAEACKSDFQAYISQYSRIAISKEEGSENSKLVDAARIDAIIREAKIVGSQAGRARRSSDIIDLLDSKRATDILNSFSFRELMYESNIVPPVITEVGPSVSIENEGRKARTSRKSWRIIKPAYITTGSLSWQSYLISGYGGRSKPRGIYAFYAPKGKADVNLWRENYCNSYEGGFETANAAFLQNLNRFKRDYMGMIRFKALEQAGIVSRPETRETRVGIVVNDNWTVIDQRDFRITVDSKFKDNEEWDNTYVQYAK
jgi:defect-in-organelle-trafficking protein DotC